MSEEIKEILEIFKKINEEYSIDTELDFEDYEIPNIYLKQFLDYITNLQENYERIYNENCKLREEHNITDISLLDENNRLKEENKKLKELCDKYEEEHNTTFEEWQKDIKANKKAIEYIEGRFDYVLKDESFLDHDDLAERRIALHLLNILQGSDKE